MHRCVECVIVCACVWGCSSASLGAGDVLLHERSLPRAGAALAHYHVGLEQQCWFLLCPGGSLQACGHLAECVFDNSSVVQAVLVFRRSPFPGLTESRVAGAPS
jgi:hypothetical protein